MPAANTWGCEQGTAAGEDGTGGTNASKYVATIETTQQGVIVVTTSDANDLPTDAQNAVITVTPYINATTAVTGTNYPTNRAIYKWVCGIRGTTGTVTTMPLNYLPASCRGDVGQ